MVFCFLDSAEEARVVPKDLEKIAYEMNALWAWCAILTPTAVRLFRVTKSGIETHGPAALPAAN
jgi:hypothetical protein